MFRAKAPIPIPKKKKNSVKIRNPTTTTKNARRPAPGAFPTCGVRMNLGFNFLVSTCTSF